MWVHIEKGSASHDFCWKAIRGHVIIKGYA